MKKVFLILAMALSILANSAKAQDASFGIGAGFIQVFSPFAIGLNVHADLTARFTESFGMQFAGDLITGSGGVGGFVSLKPLFFAELFSGSKFYIGPLIGFLLSSAGQALGLGISFGSMQYIGENFLWFAQADILLGGVLIFNIGVRVGL